MERVTLRLRIAAALRTVMPAERAISGALLSVIFNLGYALFHGVWGISQGSAWLMTLCAYYCILTAARFAAIVYAQKNASHAVLTCCGVLLSILSFVLGITTYLCLSENIATQYGAIVMITIATYVAVKVTLAIMRSVRKRKRAFPVLLALRCISYAEVAVSVMNMQRSMLASFGNHFDMTSRALNIATGTAVWLFVLSLGIYLIRKGKTNGKIQAR